MIRIAADGKSYDIIAEQPIQPTSELPSHLLMHNFLRAKGRDNRVVLHTHPTDIIGMTHCKPFLDSEKITRTLWSKSAQIYFSARMTGYEPEGMTDQQLDDLVPAFGL